MAATSEESIINNRIAEAERLYANMRSSFSNEAILVMAGHLIRLASANLPADGIRWENCAGFDGIETFPIGSDTPIKDQ